VFQRQRRDRRVGRERAVPRVDRLEVPVLHELGLRIANQCGYATSLERVTYEFRQVQLLALDVDADREVPRVHAPDAHVGQMPENPDGERKVEPRHIVRRGTWVRRQRVESTTKLRRVVVLGPKPAFLRAAK